MLTRLSKCKATSITSKNASDRVEPIKIIRKFFDYIKNGCEVGTGGRILKLMFPEFDIKRRYGMKETTLKPILKSLLNIDFSSDNNCLGSIVEHELSIKCSTSIFRQISIKRVDELLDELAARCVWSCESVKAKRSKRSKESILSDLLSGLHPIEVGFLVQVSNNFFPE